MCPWLRGWHLTLLVGFLFFILSLLHSLTPAFFSSWVVGTRQQMRQPRSWGMAFCLLRHQLPQPTRQQTNKDKRNIHARELENQANQNETKKHWKNITHTCTKIKTILKALKSCWTKKNYSNACKNAKITWWCFSITLPLSIHKHTECIYYITSILRAILVPLGRLLRICKYLENNQL